MLGSLLSILIIIIFLSLPSEDSFGQSKTGTSAAAFLSIGVGARAIGMGEAYVAVSNDALALYWNPGGLAFIDAVSITTTHTEWFAGLSHDFAGISVPVGEGAIGVSASFFTSDKIELTTGKARYYYFHGNKYDVEKMSQMLRFNILPYPKGDNQRYDTSYKPTIQTRLF